MLAVAAGVLAACGSSGGTGGAANTAATSSAAPTSASSSTASTAASATTVAATTAATTAASAAGSSDDGKLAASICDVIRATQADMPAGSVTAAYQTTFVLKAADALALDDLKAINTGRLDAPVKAACPTEYSDFLRQADVTSLQGL